LRVAHTVLVCDGTTRGTQFVAVQNVEVDRVRGSLKKESHLFAWLAFTTWATGVWIFLLLVAFVALIISTPVAGRRAARTSARWSPRAESRRGGPGCADSNLSLDRG
jgi:hypothetical protein